jgi:hypothetical protein
MTSIAGFFVLQAGETRVFLAAHELVVSGDPHREFSGPTGIRS